MDIFSRKVENIEWPREKYKNEYLNLVRQINSTDPYVLFIGAGVSKNIYPDWEELVAFISAEMAVVLTEEEKNNKGSCALQILERCKLKNSAHFYSLLRGKFNPDGKLEHKPLHIDLLTLPLSGFITTNIDICLRRAALRLPDDIRLTGFHYYPDLLPSSELKNRKLFHIHGIAINHNNEDTIETTILTESDYIDNYPTRIEPFLRAVFNEVCVIFIGFSFRDPAIQKILEGCKKHQDELKKLTITRTSKDVNHSIFLESIYKKDSKSQSMKEYKQAEDKEDENLLSTYNLHVIRYNNRGELERTDLNNIINNLIVETKKPKRQKFGE